MQNHPQDGVYMYLKLLLISLMCISTCAVAGTDFGDTVQAECKLKYTDQANHPDSRGEIDGLYRIERDGDSLFARYRHQPTRDMVRTDDVAFNHITGNDELDRYNHDGLVDLLLSIAGISRSELKSINYYGIDQKDDGPFEMELWKLMGSDNRKLKIIGSGGRWHVPCEDSLK